MMKYEYGVEYETNGEKPDLPDDVVIECFDGVKWWGGYNYLTGFDLTPKELTFKSYVTEKFRIVDERYKPKEQDMNDNWYEKGELPPVGSVVSFHRSDKHKASLFTKQWCEGDHLEVLAHKKGETEDVVVVWNQRLNKACGIVLGCLKPIRTERDALVEKAEMDIHQRYIDMISRHHIHALIDAGWRPVKQQSEDEFVDQSGLDDDSGRILYRAGCRFIEQVRV